MANSSYYTFTCQCCGHEFKSVRPKPRCSYCESAHKNGFTSTANELNRIAKEASEHGMTYGAYVSKYGV